MCLQHRCLFERPSPRPNQGFWFASAFDVTTSASMILIMLFFAGQDYLPCTNSCFLLPDGFTLLVGSVQSQYHTMNNTCSGRGRMFLVDPCSTGLSHLYASEWT